MKTKTLRRKSVSLLNSRWSAYATAGAATVLGCAATTEEAVGAIHYSGPINQFFSGNSAYFQLDQPGDSINPAHFGSAGFGAGLFFMYGLVAGSVAGFTAPTGFKYASKLGSSVIVNNLTNWASGFGTLAYGSGYTYSQWKTAGTGFVGFRFDNGSGFQYGWARLDVDGTPGNTFTLVDFVWGDLGDTVHTGVIPEPGSLALLALGAVGLVAWRKRRAQPAA